MRLNVFIRLSVFIAFVILSGGAWAQSAPTTLPSTRPAAGAVNPFLFPGSFFQGTPQTNVTPPPGCKLLHLTTAAGDHITALFGLALDGGGQRFADPKLRPTFIFFYGNGDCIASSMGVFNQCRRIGVNIIIPDYVGYGMSGGRPTEAGCYATADACYDCLVGQSGVPARKIFSVGWSLGAAVATDLASRREVAGLAIFNAFTSITDMSHRMFPWLPAGVGVVYPFDNLKKIPTIRVPIFLCNGLRDTFVPPTMSEQLAAAAGGPVTRVRIATADHNSIFTADPNGVFMPLRQFVAVVARP